MLLLCTNVTPIFACIPAAGFRACLSNSKPVNSFKLYHHLKYKFLEKQFFPCQKCLLLLLNGSVRTIKKLPTPDYVNEGTC